MAATEGKESTDGKNQTSVVIRVQAYDVDAGTSKQASVASIDVESLDAFKKKKLGEIRSLLMTEKVLDSRQQQSAFCTNKGAEVRDKTIFSVYIGLQATESDPSPPPPKPNDETSGDKDSAGATATDTPKTKSNEYDVYLITKPKKKREAPEKGFLSDRLGVSVDGGKITIPEAKWEELESTFNKSDWQASADEFTHPSEMTEQDWNRVIRNNSLMNGNVFSIVENKSREKKDKLEYVTKVDKAPYPAFKLKPRIFERYELDTKPDIDVKTEYYMPRYIVADDSYVDVFETADAISTSLASSSFSQTDIEGSIGGGAGGFSGEVKAGFSKSTQEAISKAAAVQTRTMNISYNFPRVVIYFDKWSIELTAQCSKELEAIESTRDLVEWHHKFGQFFARRVELGGRLFSSESSSNISGASASEKANRMKIAASASFSSPVVQASASASHQTESTDKETQAQSRLNKSISWRAQGGNTLLANNPPAWCSTVGPYQNWRTCQQSDVVGMMDFIRTLSPDLRETVDDKMRYKVGGEKDDDD